MKILFKLFILVFGISAFGQSNRYELAPPAKNENCQVLSSSTENGAGLKLAQCKQSVSEAPKFLVVKSEFHNLPEFIKMEFKGKRSDIKEWDQVYLSVTTKNDDVMFIGLCKAKDTTCSDDVGYTVGSSITLGGVFQNRYDVELKIENGLYSKQIPGTEVRNSDGGRTSQQNIRSEIVMEFLVNSARQQNLFYWSLGTGIVGISSAERFGFLDAAKQQRTLHNFMNSLGEDLAVNRININDGQDDVWGVYLLAGYGMQKFFSLSSPSIDGRAYAQITTRMSTLDNHSNLRLESGIEAGKSFSGRQRVAIGGNVASTVHNKGALNEASVYVKYESGRRFESSLGFTCARGKLQNHSGYNIPNTATGKPDCLYQLKMKYYLDK